METAQKPEFTTIQAALQSIYPKVNVNLSDVELTQAEIDAALEQARIKKQMAAEEDLKANRRLRMNQEALRLWDAKEQYQKATIVAQTANPNYKVDEGIKNAFMLLCLYFTNDKRFEEKGYSLNKGIMLSGNVGVGKTLMMYAFSRNKRQCFDIIPATNMTDDFLEMSKSKTEDPIESLFKYYAPVKTLLGTFEFFLQKQIGLCIDDVGEEPSPLKNYGNEINVIEHILMKRYSNKVDGCFTHITTNLDGDGIERKYGARLRSRMREMFNAIEIGGDDRRR